MDLDNFEFKPITDGLGFRNQSKRAPLPPENETRREETFRDEKFRDETLKEEAKPRKEIIFDDKSERAGAASAKTPSPRPKSNLFAGDYDEPLREIMAEPPQPSTAFFESAQESLSDLIEALPPSLEADIPNPTGFSGSRSQTEPKIFQPLPRESVKKLIEDGDIPKTIPGNRQLNTTLDTLKKGPTPGAAPVTAKSTPSQAPSYKREPLKPAPSFNAPAQNSQALNESLKRAFPQRDLSKKPESEKIAEPQAMPAPPTQLMTVPTSIGASFVDFVLVTGIALICMAVVASILKMDVLRLLGDPRTSQSVAFQLLVLAVGIMHIYFLLARGLTGSTLGDWAFDVQLGTQAEQQRVRYPFQVLWRSIVMMLTGFVLLPLLSLIMRKDVAYYLTGLKLFKQIRK